MNMEITITDDPDRDPATDLYAKLADADQSDGWCWTEGRGFFKRENGVWRDATDEEVAEIRGER